MTSDTRTRIAGLFSSKRGQWAVAIAALIILDLVVFGTYFSGQRSPGWDFIGGGNPEGFAWWHDGGFFNPVQWMPYCWGGYPGTLHIHNGAWYVPIGLASAIHPFTIWASAVLSALHVAFGALGAFVLARRWGLTFAAQIFALVTWFFVEGFFAHASQGGIMRGFAWIPWVLLVISPQFPWKRWWAPALATLILWQAILGAYVGQLTLSVYALVAWLLCVQVLLRPRFRDYLGPVLLATAMAVIMSLLVFLPTALVRGLEAPAHQNSTPWSWWLLGTFFYDYGSNELPGDITMRSFFLPVAVFVLLGMAQWRRPIVRVAAIAAAIAWALGFSMEPWSSIVGHLPGLGMSRFRMDDAKLPLLMMLTLLGAAGLDALMRLGRDTSGTRLGWGRWAYCAALLGATGAIGLLGPFSSRYHLWVLQWLIMAAAVLLVVFAARFPGRSRPAFAATLCALALLSGAALAFEQRLPWTQQRAAVEQPFGTPVSDLVAQRDRPVNTVQRPGRLDPAINMWNEEGTAQDTTWPNIPESAWWDQKATGALYSGDLAVLGYVNIKGAATWEAIKSSLWDPATAAAARAFWTAPGIGVSVNKSGDLPAPSATDLCVRTGASDGGVAVQPVAYSPHTPFVYQVEVVRTATIAFNEAYYQGWSARAISTDGETRVLTAAAGSGGEVVVTVPRGSWRLTLTYSLPGLKWAWGLFSGACAIVLAWTVVLFGRNRRSRRSEASEDRPGSVSVHKSPQDHPRSE